MDFKFVSVVMILLAVPFVTESGKLLELIETNSDIRLQSNQVKRASQD